MNRGIIGIILTAIALGLGIFILRPKIAEVRTINIDKKAKLQLVKNKETRKESLATLSNTFTKDKDKIDSLISALPQEPQIPEVLVTIETITRDSGVGVDSIAPQVDTAKQLVSVSLSGASDLSSLERLFRAVAENNRPMSVSTMSMTRGQDNNALSYNLVVTFPYVSAETKSTTAGQSGTGQSTKEGLE